MKRGRASGWVWPIDENGEAISAPMEMKDVDVTGVTFESVDGEWILDPTAARLELAGFDGPIPERLRGLFSGDDVLIMGEDGVPRSLDP